MIRKIWNSVKDVWINKQNSEQLALTGPGNCVDYGFRFAKAAEKMNLKFKIFRIGFTSKTKTKCISLYHVMTLVFDKIWYVLNWLGEDDPYTECFKGCESTIQTLKDYIKKDFVKALLNESFKKGLDENYEFKIDMSRLSEIEFSKLDLNISQNEALKKIKLENINIYFDDNIKSMNVFTHVNIKKEIYLQTIENTNEILKEYKEILNHFDNSKIYKTVLPVVKAIKHDNPNFVYITHTKEDLKDLRYFKILSHEIAKHPSDEEIKKIADKYNTNWEKYKSYAYLLFGWRTSVVDEIVYTCVNLYLDFENSVFNSFHELGHVVDYLDTRLLKLGRENVDVVEATCQLFGYKFLMMFTNTKEFEYAGDDLHPNCEILHEQVLKYDIPKRMTFEDLVKFKFWLYDIVKQNIHKFKPKQVSKSPIVKQWDTRQRELGLRGVNEIMGALTTL